MSATVAMPLLLELSQPVKTSSLQQNLLKEDLDNKYNPLTQVKEGSNGFRMVQYTNWVTTHVQYPDGSDS